MNRHDRRAARTYVRKEAAKMTAEFVVVPPERYPDGALLKRPPLSVHENNRFLVLIYREPHGYRISVMRRVLRKDGEFADGISWDDLQDIKRALGYGDYYAIEIYPRDRDVVNVANLRHLWVLEQPLDIGWFNS